MPYRIYLMPITGTGALEDSRRPAYADTDLLGINWAMLDYGNEPFCLVAADVDGATHSALTAHADVVSPPADLDQQVGMQLTVVQDALEAAHVPAHWVTSTMSYRSIVRGVAALFMFAQRLQGIYHGRLFDSGVTLSTQFNQLPSAIRQALLDAAASLNFDTSSLSGGSTLRQIIKAMGDQWPALEIYVGGQVF